MIYYIKGVRERLKEYEDYLVHPPEGQERYQTSYERAFEKVNNIIDFIKEELSKPNPILYRCPYTNFRGGNLNRKMLKYNDPQTPQTKWCISVAKNGEDWVVFGIEQDKALASRDIRENTKMLSLQQYIFEYAKKWTKETCEEEARKYKTRGEFIKGNVSAYNVALKNGWLGDYDWFEQKHHDKWTKETCAEEARKYKTRNEFRKSCDSAYKVARKNGWLDDYDWFRDERFDLYKDPIDMVYAYFFHDLNAVYVGRTLMRLQQDRDKAHIFDEKDAVVKFAKENNVPSPPMVTLEKDLTLEQGAKQEGYWVEHFKKEGWNILNRKKTGSIGGLGKGKWNKESCEREARKYKSRGEFRKSYENAYNVAHKNGWLDEFFPKKSITEYLYSRIAIIQN